MLTTTRRTPGTNDAPFQPVAPQVRFKFLANKSPQSDALARPLRRIHLRAAQQRHAVLCPRDGGADNPLRQPPPTLSPSLSTESAACIHTVQRAARVRAVNKRCACGALDAQRTPAYRSATEASLLKIADSWAHTDCAPGSQCGLIGKRRWDRLVKAKQEIGGLEAPAPP